MFSVSSVSKASLTRQSPSSDRMWFVSATNRQTENRASWRRTLYKLGAFGSVLKVVGKRVLAGGIGLDGRDGRLVDREGLGFFCDVCHGDGFELICACGD